MLWVFFEMGFNVLAVAWPFAIFTSIVLCALLCLMVVLGGQQPTNCLSCENDAIGETKMNRNCW